MYLKNKKNEQNGLKTYLNFSQNNINYKHLEKNYDTYNSLNILF